MKRSEALQKISDVLCRLNLIYGECEELGAASEILSVIEELGMLPPATDIYCTCSHADGEANKWDDLGI